MIRGHVKGVSADPIQRKKGARKVRDKMRNTKRILVCCLVATFFITCVPAIWAGEEAKQVNINQASVEEIALLKNIGPKYAERIVQYRQANGPFKSPEDLMKVKGIGPKTLELNKELITTE
jgi:competence protein ComEA